MEREAWVREYGRLVTAYNKTRNAEQLAVYYAALAHYPNTAVAEAVTVAIRESRSWPSAAELAERASNYLAGHQLPTVLCPVCRGERFTRHVCERGMVEGQYGKPCPDCGIYHEHVRGPLEFCRLCHQCHPAATKDSAA